MIASAWRLARTLAIGFGLLAAEQIPAGAAVPDYARVISALAAAGMPVLLPARLPAQFGAIRSIAVIQADRSGYYVAFSPSRTCSGALSCATLHVAAYRAVSAAGRDFGKNQLIRLPDGMPGFYSPRDCSGASCTEASLTFRRHRFIYEIDAKIERDDLASILHVYSALRCVGSIRTCPGH